MKSILVVEDSPVNMELAVCLLEYDGYDVAKAMDGEQALQLVKEKDFDLILLDIQLPGMDGLELLGMIKDMESKRDIPVIALTANAMTGDEENTWLQDVLHTLQNHLIHMNSAKLLQAL